MQNAARPYIVAVGGTQRENSSTAAALRLCLVEAERHGAATRLFSGAALDLPFYDPAREDRTPGAVALIDSLRRADGVILASPGYHGSVSGLFKNALDYMEDTAKDERPYLSGRAVGCVTGAAGWQAGGPVLASLRAMVHAMRGWPTPLGVQINTSEKVFDSSGLCMNASVEQQLRLMTCQVLEFAGSRPQCTNT
jgi:FMN reductase